MVVRSRTGRGAALLTLAVALIVIAVLVAVRSQAVSAQAATSVSLSVNNPAADEDTGILRFTISATPTPVADILVDVATIPGGSAAIGADFVPLAATVVIPAGSASRVASVTVVVEDLVELDETVILELTNPRAAGAAADVSINQAQGVGTIRNDDVARLRINDVSRTEGDSPTSLFRFTVTLDAAVDVGFQVPFATADITARAPDNDYVAVQGALAFAGTAGETRTVDVTIAGDRVVELDETFAVDLLIVTAQGRDVIFADGQGLGTIRNDDSARLTIDDASMNERDAGTTLYRFTVTLDAPVDARFHVPFATVNGSALASAGDYVTAAGTRNFTGAAGETKTINIIVNADRTVELDETFAVRLIRVVAGGRDIRIDDPEGLGTIRNDDAATLSVADATIREGQTGVTVFTFPLTLSSPVDVDVSLAASTSALTARGGGVDFIDLVGDTAAVPALSLTGAIVVQVMGESVVELDEAFSVILRDLRAAGRAVTFAAREAVGTIFNDDQAQLSINNVTQLEGDQGSAPFTFTVTLGDSVDAPVHVAFVTEDFSARAGSDYVAAQGTLSFTGAAGETKTIAVTVHGDTLVERDETFVLRLVSIDAEGRDVTFADSTGAANIVSDDEPDQAGNIDPLLLLPPDDGISDAIQTGANTFNDGAGTAGTIVVQDNATVFIEDAPGNGVLVRVEGAGSGFAILEIDGFRINLTDGDLIRVAGGSLALEAVVGPVEIETIDDLVVIIEEDTKVRILASSDRSLEVANRADSLGNVTVRVNGDDSVALHPGERWIAGASFLFQTASSLGAFTVWDGGTITVAEAIAPFTHVVRIVWAWTGTTWVFYAPSVPAPNRTNFALISGMILWVVGV